MGKSVKHFNHYTVGYFTTIENNLIYLNTSPEQLSMIDLDLLNTDELFQVTEFLSTNNISQKQLIDISQSHLLSEEHSQQTDYLASFFTIISNTIIYHEAVSDDWYNMDLSGYNNDQKFAILDIFADHEIDFVDTA